LPLRCLFGSGIVLGVGPNVPIEQHGIRDRKAAQKNEFLLFFGFRICLKNHSKK